MKDIKSLNIDELTSYITDSGYQKYRAKQIYSWLIRGAQSYDEMTDLPADLKAFLKDNCYIANAIVKRRQQSKLDDTVKYLFELFDGEYIESVVMRYHHGSTICISTQVGCKMGCSFCATGKSGFSRNLTPSEMLSQIHCAQRDLNIRISNVVLMGMGEPLDNYDNVIKFLQLVSSDDNLNIGMRHITLSTCGIVPKIYDLAEQNLQITLSISLHAPNDILRNTTMPVNRAYNINELIEACKYYIKRTNRRITFEYALIDGVNDSDSCARELCALLHSMLCHVNLIPVNSVKGTRYKKSKLQRQQSFINILSQGGITATLRRTLGSDIEASCGQLKRNFEQGGI